MSAFDADGMYGLLTGLWRRAEETGQQPVELPYYRGYPTLTVGDTTMYTAPGRNSKGLKMKLDEVTREGAVLFFFLNSDGKSVNGFRSDAFGGTPRSWSFERFSDEFRGAFEANYRPDESAQAPSP